MYGDLISRLFVHHFSSASGLGSRVWILVDCLSLDALRVGTGHHCRIGDFK